MSLSSLTVFVSFFVVLNMAKSPQAYAGKPQEAAFVFKEVRVDMLISNSKSANPGTKLEKIEFSNEWLNHMELETPQFASQMKTKVAVALIEKFDGANTLQSDIKASGFEATQQKEKLRKGQLYYWTTPTEGSAIYYYLQNPSDDKMALKIGPLAGLVAQDLDFNWNKARWSKVVK